MKKRLLGFTVLALLVAGGIWARKWSQKERASFPNPLSELEEKKFLLAKQLTKAELGEFSGPFWNKESQGLEIVLSSGIKVIFSPQQDLAKQVNSLQLILKKSRMINTEGKKMKVIDLRSFTPYVSYEDH